MTKRVLGSAILIVLVSIAGVLAQRQTPQGPLVQVYKTPTCGCCANWVKHLQDNGFTTRVVDMPDLADIKTKKRGRAIVVPITWLRPPRFLRGRRSS